MNPEDYEVGLTKRSRTLVAMGDDWPDQWAGWLEDAVEQYDALVEQADDAGLDLEALQLEAHASGQQAFAERLGVEFESEFWEGECISGHFVCGWIKTKEIPKATAAAHRILAELKAKISDAQTP
jgi:hypothetical protein